MPTLNDLYWNPGGNPNLKDETSLSWDVSLEAKHRFNSIDISAETTYYRMMVDNWIMWIPKGNGYIWEPVNFTKVLSQGAELNLRISANTGKFQHLLTGVYTYAKSVDYSIKGNETYDRQIAYVPRNRWGIGYRVEYNGNLWMHYNANYTGVRFTSADESYRTNAYTLHNIELGYNFHIKARYRMALSGKVENIFNAYYESTQYYPMPLRMFWGRLTFKI